MSREAIAKALKRLREESGLTADQVGALVGKSGKTVNAWENNRGQPDAEVLMQLCDIYNVKDILAEFREDSYGAQSAPEETKKSPDTEKSASGDDITRKIMALVRRMNQPQKELLYELLRTAVAKNQESPAFAQDSADQAAQESEPQDLT